MMQYICDKCGKLLEMHLLGTYTLVLTYNAPKGYKRDYHLCSPCGEEFEGMYGVRRASGA